MYFLLSSIDELIADLANNATVSIALALSGFLLKILYDTFRNRIWRRPMRKLFGPLASLKRDMLVVLPVFRPLTEDNFASGNASVLTKDALQDDAGKRLSRQEVPLYSDVIVQSDYEAYRQIEELFFRYRYGYLRFLPDFEALQIWKKPLILCLGGPRSNLKLRQTLNLLEDTGLTVEDSGPSLEHLVVTVGKGDEAKEFRPTPTRAYGWIAKLPNPRNPKGFVMSVFGDSAVSTHFSAVYLHSHLGELARKYGDAPFVITLAADRGNLESVTVEHETSLS